MGSAWGAGAPPPSKGHGCGYWLVVLLVSILFGWVLVQAIITAYLRTH